MESEIRITYKIDKETSSLIKYISWKQGILYITFRTNDKMYAYKKVPKEIVISLVSAESVGKYFNKNIKNNFEYEIVEEETS